MCICVHLGQRSYDIAVTTRDPAGIGPFARERCRGATVFLVTDQNVAAHAAAVTTVLEANGFRVAQTNLPAGEPQKSLTSASQLYEELVNIQADRNTAVFALGGGVIGDLVGFVAATYARGLPLLMIPTTLLAMVDSSVGGKVGVNHPKGKNLIGAFHQPVGVWIDTAMLDSLPDREFRSGLAEVVKYGVSLDGVLFTYLEEHADRILRRDAECLRHIITRSCELKASIVERDEREEIGLRSVLNYGHTFGHAFETVGGYGTWLHGEAIAAGMMCAARLAERQGMITAELTQRQRRLLEQFGLPTTPREWPVEHLLAVMRNDKKAVAGQMGFVLPQSLGSATLFHNIPEAEVRAVLTEARGA